MPGEIPVLAQARVFCQYLQHLRWAESTGITSTGVKSWLDDVSQAQKLDEKTKVEVSSVSASLHPSVSLIHLTVEYV